MSGFEMGAQPTFRQVRVQAGPSGRFVERLAGRLGRAAHRWGAVPALVVALSGCASPLTWLHRSEGGQIAQPRPPPPGENGPYPNLASVPARPAPPDQAALQQISNALIADRINAEHLTTSVPPTDPSQPAASPGLFGIGTTPPPPPAPGASAASATLAAASATPTRTAAPAAPTSAPSAPLVSNAPTVTQVQPPPALPIAPPPPPTLANGPPLPNSDYGGGPTGAATAGHSPATPPVGAVAALASPTGLSSLPPASAPGAAPPPSAPSLPANPATTVDVLFAPLSAQVPPVSAGALQALAAKRGDHIIAVVGHGDAASPDPDAQAHAMALALRRAQAIATTLTADAVPQSAVRIAAEASGRGGSARIIE